MALQDPSNPKQYLADGYDKQAGEYLAWAQSRPQGIKHRLEIVDHLFKYLGVTTPGDQDSPTGLKVLELGCGAGEPVTLALAAHPAVGSIVANDISSTQLEMLRDNLGKLDAGAPKAKVKCAHGDMMGLHFPEGSLDAVLAFYSIIHLVQDEQTELVSRIQRWLKPGSGCLLVCFGVEENAGITNDDWLGMKSFWSSHGMEKSIRMVEAAGLQVVYKEVTDDPEDAPFLWLIARKKRD